VKYVYKIIYPNRKIYVGMCLRGIINYYGNAACHLLERDFSKAQLADFTIRREILWASETAGNLWVRKVERDFILEFQSNNPAYGYNQLPKFKPNE
jgi:hypothetical protein